MKFNKPKQSEKKKKMLSKQLLFSSFFILFSIGNSFCQENELSLYGAGIFSALDYSTNVGNQSHENGVAFGLSYHYSLSPQWRIGIGAEYQSYESRMYLRNISDSYKTTDIEGDAFQFKYQAKNYHQKQYASYVNIPLTIRYETTGEFGWYAAAGVKIGLPLQSDYRVRIQSLQTSGYYEQWNVTLEDPQFMGFGKFNSIESPKQELDLEIAYSALLEVGIKQDLGDKNRIYIGVFMDYGLNAIYDAEQSSSNLISYTTNDPTNFEYSPVFSASNKEKTYSYTQDDVRLIAYGVKLRYAFSF